MATAISYSRAFQGGLGFGFERARDGQIGAAKSKVEGLPTDQDSERGAPGGAEIVGAEHRAGDRGDRTLRQEQSEDVVPGGAIDLCERVGMGQVGGPRQANAGCRGIDLLLRNAYGRIVLERALDGLADGQRLRRGSLAHGKPGTQAQNRSAKNRGQTERFPVFTPLLAFHEFSKQLAHLDLGCLQRLPSESGRTVNLAQRLAVALLAGTQVALLLQPVKQRIQAARADPVAVPPQFFDHAEPEDGLFDGVMQDVQPNQAGVQIAVGQQAIDFRFRHSITMHRSIEPRKYQSQTGFLCDVFAYLASNGWKLRQISTRGEIE